MTRIKKVSVRIIKSDCKGDLEKDFSAFASVESIRDGRFCQAFLFEVRTQFKRRLFSAFLGSVLRGTITHYSS